MRTALMLSAALLMAGAVPAAAQMGPAASTAPLSGLSATDYVKLAADADNFEIQSGRVAAMKSKREDVKGFAKQMIADHTRTSKALMAALSNGDRKITPPSPRLSDANQAKLDLLKKAPKSSFDQLYLQQQLEAHQSALALHQGYAADGTDASLKQVATTAVPIVQQHLTMVQGMAPSAQ
ncbi:DUF4142 domain-containing protein [Sphingomonas morindae]|uniref:DUF4142 domain-containing protein n=1 Tax=Sphingomonas morindae TaxID=1541170 RepID=A0ABY4X6P4_9SPHN|nr:DUF4142 domain-containing protein [Sphingomonas morindae]USI72593.1 DUF4142 domain-containing protein [Sphingomonas morindae]